MSDQNTNLPAISRQITELVLAGSPEHAEETLNETAEHMGDLAVVEVLDALEPQVASMHLSAFDGSKLSLATLLVSPKAWAQSLAFFAAPWSDDMIEDEPELLAEALFAHIHGMLFASDDQERRSALIHEALATDWGTTAFAALFSTASREIAELATEILDRGPYSTGQTSSDHDIVPLALAVAQSDPEGWDRVLFELFPNWQPGEHPLEGHEGYEEEDTGNDEEEPGEEHWDFRSTQELLQRLRKQVPTRQIDTRSNRPGLGEDIFA